MISANDEHNLREDAPLLDRLASLSTWLGEFPFQRACVQGERIVNEAIAAIEGLQGELEERRCQECHGDLSACGDMTSDGPRMDCQACRLDGRIRELESEITQLREAVRVLGGRVRMSVQSTHAVLGRVGETWEHFITDDVLANPIASAAVRAAKEQA